MKINQGFVSNSSSCSFIVVGAKPPCTSAQLKESQIRRIMDEFRNRPEPVHSWDPKPVVIERHTGEPVYLTTHLSDVSSPWETWHDPTLKIPDGIEYHVYREGGHGGPCSTEKYDKIADDVWILKEHNNSSEVEGQQEFDFIEEEIEI